MRTWFLTKAPEVRRYLLIGLVVGVPVLFLRLVQDPFNVPKLAFLLAGLAVVVALRATELIQGAPAAGLRRLLIPAAAIAVPLIVGWLFSDYRGWAVFGLYGRFQGLVPYLAVIVLGILVADAFAGHVRTLAWALVSAGGFIGFYALLQAIGADPFTWATAGENVAAALSTVGNPNFTGGILAIILPIAVGLWIIEPKQRRKLTMLTTLIAIGWIVPTSQGGWAAGLAGVLAVLAFLVGPRIRFGKQLGLIAAGGVALAMVVLVFVSLIRDLPLPGTTIRARGDWWVAASRLWQESPIVGHGPNGFAVEGVQHRTVRDAVFTNYDFANDPHSVFFSFLVAGGILGALGYLTLLGWTIYKATQIRADNPYAVVFFGGAIAYFAQSLVSIDELSIRVACWAVLGGLAASLTPTTADAKAATPARKKKRKAVLRREPLRTPIAVGAVGLVALLGVWYALNILIADGRVRNGSLLFSQQQYESARGEFESALGFRPDYHYRGIYGLELGEAAIEVGETGRDLIEEEQQQFAFLEEFPDVPRTVEHARLLFNFSQFDVAFLQESLEWYERALGLDPINPLIRVEMADVLLNLDRPDEAVATLAHAEPYVGDIYPQFWGMLGLCRAHAGDREGALVAIERALALEPSQPQALEAQSLVRGEQSTG